MLKLRVGRFCYEKSILCTIGRSLSEWISSRMGGVGDETERYFGNTHQNLKCQRTFGFILWILCCVCVGGEGTGVHEDLDVGVLIEAFFRTSKIRIICFQK